MAVKRYRYLCVTPSGFHFVMFGNFRVASEKPSGVYPLYNTNSGYAYFTPMFGGFVKNVSEDMARPHSFKIIRQEAI